MSSEARKIFDEALAGFLHGGPPQAMDLATEAGREIFVSIQENFFDLPKSPRDIGWSIRGSVWFIEGEDGDGEQSLALSQICGELGCEGEWEGPLIAWNGPALRAEGLPPFRFRRLFTLNRKTEEAPKAEEANEGREALSKGPEGVRRSPP